MFVNRHSELDLLEKHYKSGRAELFVLYGRRRVGKTELLAHFCQNKWHVFFVADQVVNNGGKSTQKRELESPLNRD